MNKTILMGRLTKDVNFKDLENGTKIANYTLAVPINGKKDQADYIPCTAFNEAAVFAKEYFKKGLRVLVEAHLKPNSYTNKEGVKVYTLEVIVEKQHFADGTGKYGITEDGLYASLPDDVD